MGVVTLLTIKENKILRIKIDGTKFTITDKVINKTTVFNFTTVEDLLKAQELVVFLQHQLLRKI